MNKLILLFDFRLKSSFNSQADKFQKMEIYYLDYLKISKRNNFIIFIDEKFHEYYHEIEYKLMLLSFNPTS